MCIGEAFARKFPRMLTVVILLSFFHIFVFDFLLMTMNHSGVSWWLSGKESACSAGDAGDTGSSPGPGRSPVGGNGNPLHYCCLGNSMDRRAWRAVVHGVAESQT